MAATSKFEDVFNFVSNSKLNFSIYKTPFSAQISVKNSFVKYFQENEALANDTDAAKNNEETIFKSELVKSEENRKDISERENLQAKIEKNLKEIDDLRHQNKHLETKLKESKKESKKNQQRADKLRPV